MVHRVRVRIWDGRDSQIEVSHKNEAPVGMATIDDVMTPSLQTWQGNQGTTIGPMLSG